MELEEFRDFLNRQEPTRAILDADKDDINLFLSHRGADNSPSQKRWTLAPIRGYFKYLQEEGIRPDNPTTGVRLPRLARRRDDRFILTRGEVKKLLDAPHGRLALRDKAIIRLFYAGLKRGEVNALSVRDVDLDRREVNIDGRHVPITQETAEAIGAYLKAHPIAKGRPLFLGRAKGPMGYRQLWQIVKTYADRCGLDEKTNVETLRATYAVHAMESGISYIELIDTLGTYNDDWLRDLTRIARDQVKIRQHNAELGSKPKRESPQDASFYAQLPEAIRLEARWMSRHYEQFYLLENSIRKLVTEKMSKTHGLQWWTNHVSQGVKDNVEKNRKREADAGVTMRSSDPIDYTTFGELSNIIQENWDVFSDTFTNRNAAVKVFGGLNMLRGPIAHCCPLAPDEISRLDLAIRDYFRLME